MNNIFRCIFESKKKSKLFLSAYMSLMLAIPTTNTTAADAADFSITEAQSIQVSQEQDAEYTLMSFSAFGQTFNLLMKKNDALMKNYSARLVDVELYAGTIEGIDGSWARITKVNNQFSGAIYDGYELYMLDNGNMVSDAVDPSLKEVMQETETVLYRASDMTSTLTCGDHGEHGEEGHDENAHSPFSYKKFVAGLRQQREAAVATQSTNSSAATATTAAATATQQVNLSIVADTQYVATSPNGAQAQVLSQMNIVDGIFSEQVGVQFGITDIEALTDNGPLTSTDPSDLLGQYRSFIGNNNPGLSHLFTGREIDGNVIGIAFLSGICTTNGVGLTQAGGRGTFGALTAAHEFGHNFGAPHDNQAGSACATSPGTFLMNPSINGSDQFSQCSLQQIENVLNVRNACLVDVDVPAPAPTGPVADCNTQTSFANGANGFSFIDDPQSPAYTSSTISGGALNVAVGGVDNADISDMEGAWSRQCQSDSASQVTISVNGSLSQSPEYEANEFSQIALRINGNETVLATLTGDGNGGATQSTGTQQFTTTATLPAGTNTIELLCFNNLKTFNNEETNCSFTSINIDSGNNTVASGNILNVAFNSAFGGFSFVDDSNDPIYADGDRTANNGVNNSGALETTLGGIDSANISNIEGTWTRNFTATEDGQLTLSLDGNLVQAEGYEANESSEIGVMIDNRSLVLNTVVGDGNGGGTIGTGFQRYNVSFNITAGTHSVSLFCRNSDKTATAEVTTCTFDNVVIE